MARGEGEDDADQPHAGRTRRFERQRQHQGFHRQEVPLQFRAGLDLGCDVLRQAPAEQVGRQSIPGPQPRGVPPGRRLPQRGEMIHINLGSVRNNQWISDARIKGLEDEFKKELEFWGLKGEPKESETVK